MAGVDGSRVIRENTVEIMIREIVKKTLLIPHEIIEVIMESLRFVLVIRVVTMQKEIAISSIWT